MGKRSSRFSEIRREVTPERRARIDAIKHAMEPRCEVHDGDAPAVKRVIWNGEYRWVCQACLDGR